MGKEKVVRPAIPAPVAAAFVDVMWAHIGGIEQTIAWKEMGFDFVSGSELLVAVLRAVEDALPARRNTPEFEALLEAARRGAARAEPDAAADGGDAAAPGGTKPPRRRRR